MKQWWQVLGVPRGSDRATIRRAYAAKLKTTNPEDDAKGFMALREAYEEGLRWVEYGHFDDWDEADDDENAEAVGLGGDDPAPVLIAERDGTFAEPALAEEPFPPLPPPAAPPPPSLDPFEAARAADADALDRLLAELDAGLRGPWFKDREALRATFEAVMAAPALMEIDRRAHIEYRLAALIADTIPRSDAILRPAMAAFGWEQEGNHPPAVWSLRARLDEWRLIASFGRGHPLTGGWRALIDGKAPDWLRRIAALRPGVAAQVRQLFDLADYDVPGIAHSFHPKAAGWWRAHLDAPRFGFAEVALVLIGALAATLFALAGATQETRLWGAVAAGVAGVALAVMHWRYLAPMRWRRAQGLAATPQGFGWRFGLWMIVTMIAVAVPATPWIAGGIAAAAFALALTIFVLDGNESSGGGVPWQRAVILGVAGIFIGPAFAAMNVAEQVLVLVFGASCGLIGLTARYAIARLIAVHPILIALGLTLSLIVAAIIRSDWAVGTPLIPWGAAACTGLVLMGGLRAADPGGRGEGVAGLVNMLLWATLVIAAVLSVPDEPGQGNLPPPISVVPADPMKALESAEPGFREVRTGNPKLYAEVAAVRTAIADGSRDPYAGSKEIDRLVNAAYQNRLPLASAALIAAEMDIRLAHLRELRTVSAAACVSDPGAGKPVLSKALRARSYAHALRVAAGKPEGLRVLAKGREIASMELLRIAANGDVATTDRLAKALAGTDPAARCDARIAMMEALVAQDDIDIAKTMRPTLIARAEPKTAKK